MNSGSDDSNFAPYGQSQGETVRFTPQQDCSSLIRPEQTFSLIESTMLTLEVCLYHQVLPISLDGHRMNLGMVDPTDEEALSYIQTILAYLSYTLVPKQISLQAHKDTLSAYLKHRENPQRSPFVDIPPDPKTQAPLNLAPAVTKSPPAALLGLPSSSLPVDLNSRETIFIEEEEEIISAAQTVVIFTSSESEEQAEWTTSNTPQTLDSAAAPSQPLPSQPLIDEPQTTAQSDTQLEGSDEDLYYALPNTFQGDVQTSNQSAFIPLTLDIQPRYLNSPIKLLESLPAQDILNEVLARVLSGGIGRLFFERRTTHGRVIWSQNGIIKAELENIPIAVFDELMQHLKRLHNLPIDCVKETVRVEIERFYDQQRLLLRLQVMPGLAGEEANLQILRGVALQFYQQRQLATASRDALNASQKLQHKINDIYNRAVSNNIPEKTQIEMLSALTKIVDSMDEQIRALDTLNSET